MSRNDVLTLLYKYHDKWIAIVMLLDNNIHAEDVVQDMYIKIHDSKDDIIKKAIVNNKPHIGYIKKMLYNIYLQTKNSNTIELTEEHAYTKQKEVDPITIEQRIDEIVNSFYWFDRKLFNLYRKEFKTIRSLSKATKISHVVVHNTIWKCKNTLKKKLNEK